MLNKFLLLILMDEFEKIKILLSEAESHRNEFYRKDNLRASVKYRRILGKIKAIIHNIRMDVLNRKKQISSNRMAK